ncbi:iron-sulfur cluster biosynthesis family protein [Salisediminibacterium halotolerans]|uniref:Uncharacterized protein YneR n=1 Tax=Salisediminibacterium halotolerans TaxID=517425 RepID=A0A1H9RSZ6_9BACI|nr:MULTISPECIES: iron-sulfur cluster biosynthesis family protein [Salisediminibacterium]RLJ74075.1 uncharacterized protein YneR [Actinophytocola xinjiangensis]RPE87832.1 uncharacterized protein YneR [Salisediminibacterium halotolerans]TWG34912.1 uncharacterized protein YneR [Salisediminibacterium halotolerans]SER75912.1 Uncharacterized protein YneR [Salisediminibacterium haloalkalitolerans]GEL07901.1 hypothetical protein SHA02_13170 [Salisediminibacterium halotolerans]
MNLTITNEAVQFYKQELNLADNDTLTLYVRVGGVGSGGFSAGLSRGRPDHSAVYKHEEQGIIFYIAEDDAWYFDGMTIDYDADFDAVTYNNPRIDDVTNPK